MLTPDAWAQAYAAYVQTALEFYIREVTAGTVGAGVPMQCLTQAVETLDVAAWFFDVVRVGARR